MRIYKYIFIIIKFYDEDDYDYAVMGGHGIFLARGVCLFLLLAPPPAARAHHYQSYR